MVVAIIKDLERGGFWGQTKRWKRYWAEDPKGPIFVAKRTDTAKHQLEPSQIEYFQSPRRRHSKILFVTATIQTPSGDKSKTIEMSNRMIPGPSSVLHACFYPGLYHHHLAVDGFVSLGGREKDYVMEELYGMTMDEISKIIPDIDRMAKSQAASDLAHYNRLTDFGDDFSGLRDVFGNLRTQICHVGHDHLDYERELHECPPNTPLPSCSRNQRKRDADKKRAAEANRKTG